MSKRRKDVPSGRAISIQQPFVEMILNGKKKYEYRSRQTHIRGRVYLYASKNKARLIEHGHGVDRFARGVIVGSVEIVDCREFDRGDYFGYKLRRPKRYKKHLKPKFQPQPCFFFPFEQKSSKKKRRKAS
ncbi:MAG: ASCH domain-containing protein [Bdellovibrionaceae bacterium]|nr:ASCH domain-containing protein [Pseudobdellovibrionaceae bacterium]